MYARLHVHTAVSKWMHEHKGLLKHEVAVKEVFLEMQGVKINAGQPVNVQYYIVIISIMPLDSTDYSYLTNGLHM